MTSKDLTKKLDNADHERVGQYMKIFDRVLLYTIAVNTMPKESLDATFRLWETIIKRGIDEDSKSRTQFLESYTGRKAKYQKEPDGEDLRLYCLKQYELARDLIRVNLSNHDQSDEEEND